MSEVRIQSSAIIYILNICLFTVNCVEKTKVKKKKPGMAPLKNLSISKMAFCHTYWLWHSWQSSCFWHQRSNVRSHSGSIFTQTVFHCVEWIDKIWGKRGQIRPVRSCVIHEARFQYQWWSQMRLKPWPNLVSPSWPSIIVAASNPCVIATKEYKRK